MILARIFTNIYKEGGIILIDAKGQKHICGNPRKEKPITIKLLKENLKWKLLVNPELEFPEVRLAHELLVPLLMHRHMHRMTGQRQSLRRN